jgi:predicted tellurium resistance membrane protein TerC
LPAVFPSRAIRFLVFTSNIMALLGLRSLYFALAGLVDRFRYLRISLGLLLVLVGTKLLLKDVLVEGLTAVLFTLGIVALIWQAASSRRSFFENVHVSPFRKLLSGEDNQRLGVWLSDRFIHGTA